MVVFPVNDLVIKDIHASYVDPLKLVAYYRQKTGSGCVHFKAADAEGIVFFNREDSVASSYHDSDRVLDGQAAMDWLVQSASSMDMVIQVYAIAPDQLAYWSGLSSATAIYSNLSTEFTDLLKLLKKMTAEKLTGYIDVDLGKDGETNRIFLIAGKFIGGTYADMGGCFTTGKRDLEKLVRKVSKTQGVFNVYSVSQTQGAADTQGAMPNEQTDVLQLLGELLSETETSVGRNKVGKGDFHTTLKKQFMQRIDQFPFLDPFAAEFQYENKTATFSGDTDKALLIQGIIASLTGLSDELGIHEPFKAVLDEWHARYADQLASWGILK